MVVLISQKTGNSKTRTCNSRCHDAKGPDCRCICSGGNHGVGLQKAIENTERVAQKLLEDNCNVKLPLKESINAI